MAGNASASLRVIIVRHNQDALRDWQAMLIDRIARDPQIEIVGMVQGLGPVQSARTSGLLGAVLALEQRLVGREILAYDKSNAQAVLSNLPTETLPKADLALEMGHHKAAPDQLTQFEHGAWSVTFGGAKIAQVAGCDPHLRNAAGMQVQIVQDNQSSSNPMVVGQAQFNRKPGAVLTGAFVEERSVLLVLQALQNLAAGRSQPPNNTSVIAAPPPLSLGHVITYATHFATAAVQKLAQRLRDKRGQTREFWRLAHGTGDLVDIDPSLATSLPTLSHIMADPFIFSNKGQNWVFYEAMDADKPVGRIDVAALDGNTLGPPATALTCPYHLSFPFIFRDGEEIYMLPETQQAHRLEVWRATDFPTKWEQHATAFEGMFLADSTMWKDEDNQWWLLTNLSDHHAFQDHSSALYLFAVDGPNLGNAKPHPCNPVAIGSDHARNAGPVMRQNGRLFRPSQNNSFGVYGYGLNLMEITQLDATGYSETLVRSWTPNDRPGIAGIHHLSAADGNFIFDWAGP